jgi:16S rRNA processing protein RimM
LLVSRLCAPSRKGAGGLPRLVRLGKVKAPHGLRGHLKVKCDNPDGSSLESLRRLFLARGDEVQEFHLAHAARLAREHFKIQLVELNDIGGAEAMRGAIVLAAVADLPSITVPHEFYYFEALGCEVRSTNGLKLGRIKQSFFTGAHDVWVVDNLGTEFLLPVVDEIVKSADFEHRVVTVELLPGLLD